MEGGGAQQLTIGLKVYKLFKERGLNDTKNQNRNILFFFVSQSIV